LLPRNICLSSIQCKLCRLLRKLGQRLPRPALNRGQDHIHQASYPVSTLPPDPFSSRIRRIAACCSDVGTNSPDSPMRHPNGGVPPRSRFTSVIRLHVRSHSSFGHCGQSGEHQLGDAIAGRVAAEVDHAARCRRLPMKLGDALNLAAECETMAARLQRHNESAAVDVDHNAPIAGHDYGSKCPIYAPELDHSRTLQGFRPAHQGPPKSPNHRTDLCYRQSTVAGLMLFLIRPL
jgi:hypothetical protein